MKRGVQILVAVAAVTAAGTALAADKVRFQTDWLPSGEHAMYYGAWQKGIYAEEASTSRSPAATARATR